MDFTRSARIPKRTFASRLLPKAEVLLTAVYLAAGTLVFVFSEPYVAAWLGDRRMPSRNERDPTEFAAKGVAFALASGLVLYLVLRRAHLSRRTTERVSQESAERFAMIARATCDAMWDLDLRNNRMWRSDTYGALFGYELSELEPSLEGWMQRLHPEEQDRVISRLRQAVRSGTDVWREEYRFQRKDGSYAFVVDRAQVLRDARGEPMRVIGGVSDVTSRRQAEGQLRHSRERYRALCGRLIGSPRGIPAGLRPDPPDSAGLLDVLRAEADRFARNGGVEVHLTLPDRLPPLAVQVRTAALRVLEEALDNVARHAQARQVDIVLRLEGNRASLEVSDDGRGIEPEALTGAGSLGILGMQEHAGLLGGELRIQSPAPGRTGTTVTLELPLGG